MLPPDPLSLLREAAPRLGFAWSETLRERFHLYLTTLQQWNRLIHLIGEDEGALIVRRHFLDSLTALPLLEECVSPCPRPALIDVGTGAGFPGIPLQMARPAWRVTLVEARRKRIHFLRHLCYELGLTEVQILPRRAEEVGQEATCREQFDVALSRAVADLRVLAEYGLPLVRQGGYFVAFKGPSAVAEAEAAKSVVSLLGGRPPRVRTVELTLEGQPWPGRFIQSEKFQPTPALYPRRPGLPAKRPLR